MPSRLLMFLMILLVPTISAQVHVTAATALVEQAGHATDALDPEGATLGPDVSREVTLGIGIDRGIWRIELIAGRSSPDLLVIGASSGIVTRNVLESTGVTLAAGPRLFGGPHKAELHLLLGATLSRWSFPEFGDPDRNRISATLAAEGALPLAGAIRGVLRLEGSLGASLFDAEDLPEGYQTRGARRMSLGVGLRWQR